MIVLDENIRSNALVTQISNWYVGKVISVLDLRPVTLIKDDGIATLLRTANRPTFVTINVKDFWPRFRADKHYCVISFVLEQQQVAKLSTLLRSVLMLPQFHTRATRMGTIVRVRPIVLEYYGIDRRIHRIPWTA